MSKCLDDRDLEAKSSMRPRVVMLVIGAVSIALLSPVLRGVLLALTSLASPTFLPSLIFVLSLLQVRGWVGHEVGDYVMYALGFGVGAALWYVLLLRTVSHFRAQFSPTVMPLLDSVAGGVLLLCAGLLTYSVVTTTAWSRLLGG